MLVHTHKTWQHTKKRTQNFKKMDTKLHFQLDTNARGVREERDKGNETSTR